MELHASMASTRSHVTVPQDSWGRRAACLTTRAHQHLASMERCVGKSRRSAWVDKITLAHASADSKAPTVRWVSS